MDEKKGGKKVRLEKKREKVKKKKAQKRDLKRQKDARRPWKTRGFSSERARVHTSREKASLRRRAVRDEDYDRAKLS